MDPLTLAEIAQMSGGRLENGGGALTASKLSKDTRNLQPGDLYLALRGEKFDGNQFLEAAIRAGAVGALVDDESLVARFPDFPLIVTADSLAALQQLAGSWRSRLSLRVVGLTGSSGKTSTKDFTAAVLGERFQVTTTAGNLNNHIGLPLSILAATSRDQFAVWEMGMNHPGEIEPLARLARPDFAIVTGIGVAHIENLGSREAIAAEKGGLVRLTSPHGAVILNAEDDFTPALAKAAPGDVITVGLQAGDLRAEAIEFDSAGSRFALLHGSERVPATLPVAGEHMVRNALLAVAVGLEAGLSLEECAAGLAKSRLTAGRLTTRAIRGMVVLDDSYNANPDSVEAALKTLSKIPAQGRRIAALGKMGELGDYAETGYRRAGRAAADGRLDILVTVGAETQPLAEEAETRGLSHVFRTDNTAAAATLLRSLARPGDLVLIKGSRSARMEQILTGLE